VALLFAGTLKNVRENKRLSALFDVRARLIKPEFA
jgi:hypothetical protein